MQYINYKITERKQ